MKRRAKKSRIETNDDSHIMTHRQRKLKYYKTRRNIRKIQMFFANLRAAFRLFVMSLMVIGFIKLINLPQWYLPSNIFKQYPNKSLQIEGNEIASTHHIMAKLRQVKLSHTPIYFLNTKPIEKELLELSPVKKVYIRRFWFPARLKIIVNERTPILSMTPTVSLKSIGIFTTDKTIIGREFLPLLKSPTEMYSIITYDNFYKWSPKQIDYIIYLARQIQTYSGQRLVYIDIRNPDDVFVQLTNVKLRIGELNRSIMIRTKRVSSVLSEAMKIKDEIDYIDLRWDNSNSIPIKLKSEEKEDLSTENNAEKPAEKTPSPINTQQTPIQQDKKQENTENTNTDTTQQTTTAAR